MPLGSWAVQSWLSQNELNIENPHGDGCARIIEH